MRSLLALFTLAAVTGCALPTALTIASAALSGASYLTTGKGPTDHLMSAATASDCDFLRALATVPRTPLCITSQAMADQPTAPIDEPGLALAPVAPAAGRDPIATAMNAATMALPADAAAAIAEAIARRDARAGEATLMAGLVPATALSPAPDYVAQADLTSAVIAAIAAHPDAVEAIVGAAIRAAPEHQATITARASAAFPGFAAAIARAADRAAA